MKLHLVFIFGCLVSVCWGETKGDNHRATCHTPGFVRTADGACAFDPRNPAASRDFSSLRHTEGRRHRRQVATGACPFCARQHWTVFPQWADCGRYYLCIDGVSLDIGCTDNSPDTLYFNPNTLRCEPTPTASNTCLFRSYVPPHVQ